MEDALKPEILRCADAAILYQTGARVFVRESDQAVQARGVFNVALAGGSTPRGLYSLLAEDEPLRSAVPWDRVQFFWGDERHVPPDHADSNYRMAYEALLSKIPVRPEQTHRVKAELADGATIAQQYEAEIRASIAAEDGIPRFDLILLGVGADGHTASLFPGTPALDERARLVVANPVEGRGERITMTLPLLNAARLVMFLAAGAEKAGAVRLALHTESRTPPVPAGLVQPLDGRLMWVLDQRAASRLEERPT